MDIQTIIVIAIVFICIVFLARKYIRAAKGTGGSCGCGCGDDCPSTRKDNCGEKENLNERRPD